jgi:predicted Zn-dependent protease
MSVAHPRIIDAVGRLTDVDSQQEDTEQPTILDRPPLTTIRLRGRMGSIHRARLDLALSESECAGLCREADDD